MSEEELAAIRTRDATTIGWLIEAEADRRYLLTLLDSVVAENAALREALDQAGVEMRRLRESLDEVNADFVTAMGWKSSHDHSD